jgi:uncharacterized protein YyaL (SSP411 family)
MSDPTRKPNRLINETSPYLLQHAHNPVDWYPWGEEALARARREDRPILLSIGYAACHWCHVMERESFENEDIARLMNEHFVCIKVDREERPDLDDIYMAATIAMSGHGGWPMTVFLTPEHKPFFAGTYFPPEDKYGRPGLPTLLARVAEVYREDREGVEKQASELTRAVSQQLAAVAPAPLALGLIARAFEQLDESYDPRWGGFGAAPKFPASAALRLLLRHHARSGEARALELVRGTLDGMKNGGMYDHLGGGFARYSVDERWHVPHFEKMLYDNGQLARVYLEAFQVTGDPEYGRVTREVCDYLLAEMQSPEGGFYSATDADSEGVEGKFFTFTRGEIEALLEPELAAAMCAYYDVTAEGNWEHTNVLWTPRPRARIAMQLGLTEEELMRRVAAGRSTLYAARLTRVPPLLDDKVLVSWNALAIGALAEAGRVLGEARYVEAATRAVRDIQKRLTRPDGGLYRTARAGRAHLDAYLEDYAYLGDAMIDLYEAAGEAWQLDYALALCERMVRDFRDAESGAFFQTAHAHEALIARARGGHDDAMPNANAIAAQLCARLSFYLARADLREAAESTLASFGHVAARAPRAFVSILAVLDLLADGPVELALVGDPGDSRTQELGRAIAGAYLPNRLLARSTGETGAGLPLLAGKKPVRGAPALYICKNFTCAAPLTDPAAVREALGRKVSHATADAPG